MFPGERFVHRMCIKKGSGQHLLSTPFCGPFLHPFVWYHKQKKKDQTISCFENHRGIEWFVHAKSRDYLKGTPI